MFPRMLWPRQLIHLRTDFFGLEMEINLSSHPLLFTLLGFLLGACLGSFLNVVVTRAPKGISVIRPASRCPHCSVLIPWTLNFPVFGWIFLRGRTKCCANKIPLRYLGVELFTGLAFGWSFHCFHVQPDLGMLLASCAFAWLMIGVVAVDAETMLIPDRFSIGGTFVGLGLCLYFPSIQGVVFHSFGAERMLSAIHCLLGILVGSGLLYWIGALASKVFGREALGEGDIKLLGCVGAFCGWKGAVFSIFGGSLLGCLLLLPCLLAQHLKSKKNSSAEDKFLGMEIPFGPYLSLAGIGYFFGLREWVDPWFKWLEYFPG